MKCLQCGTDNQTDAKICTFCNSPLATHPGAPFGETQAHAPQEIESLSGGELIANRYKIVRELGRGGMGVVYLVQDQMLQGQEIALKMISPFLVKDEAAHKRFVQEVMSAQKLSHDNIVRAYHFDRFNGQDYFTMEYLPGKSLREWMEERKASGNNFSLQESLDIIQQVLSGLDHAHIQGVIHRDLKPENIAVIGDFPDITIKILDFGLAKVMSLSRLTSAAMTMGTAYYMSPEQLAGKVDVDARSDLFPVGVILYELIVGEIPIGRFQLPGELDEGIPKEADKVIEKALSPKPDDRHESARELIDALSNISDASATEAIRLQGAEIQRKEAEKKQQEEAERQKQEEQKRRQVEEEKQRQTDAEKRVNTETFDRLCQNAENFLKNAKFKEANQSIKDAKAIFSGNSRSKKLDEKIENTRSEFETAYSSASDHINNKRFDQALEYIKKIRALCPGAGSPDLLMRKLKKDKARQEAIDFEKNKGHKELWLKQIAIGALSVFVIAIIIAFLPSDPPSPSLSKERTAQTNTPAPKKPKSGQHQNSSHSASVPKKFGLSIKPNPSNARIRIMNIVPKYSPGIKLEPGKYHIEVSKSGYERFDQWIELKQSNLTYPVVLKKNTLKAKISNSLGMEFVYINPGTFMMGSPTSEPGREDDETQHRVTLTKGYYMQTTEVTQGQWKAVMGSNPSRFKACGDDCPVDTVSWYDIQEFIRKINHREGVNLYRLPTEAEWEYACRAGATTAFANGEIKEGNIRLGCDYDSNLNAMGWYCGNSGVNYSECRDKSRHGGPKCAGSHPVAQKLPNAWGLYDLHGNLAEWCSGWYGEYPSSAVTDPTGPSSGKSFVIRGGSWGTPSQYARCAKRTHGTNPAPGDGYYFGFRLARNL